MDIKLPSDKVKIQIDTNYTFDHISTSIINILLPTTNKVTIIIYDKDEKPYLLLKDKCIYLCSILDNFK